MRVVLLGPPGAGKGTQGYRLAGRYDAKLIATGDIFRAHVQNDTELGREAQSYMNAGELVPDELVIAMVLGTLRGEQDGFILDGFPRNVAQAYALDEALISWDRPLSAVIAFALEDEVAVKRLAGRRTCSQCQRPYNVELKAPRRDNACDVCGGELVQREDDREEIVRRRLELYHESTAPLLRFYQERGVLRAIDADGTEEEVTERAVRALSVPSVT